MKVIVFASAWLACASAYANSSPSYCNSHIDYAEKFYRIPHNLLRAVALTESGRNGQPWSLAINAGGEAYYPDSFEKAAALLRDKDGNPRQDVAVGCMQIYMRYHRKSFEKPEWALNPRINVLYGARYLAELKQRYGSWTKAVAHYHSSKLEAQQVYVCRVWKNLMKLRGRPTTGKGQRYCKRVNH